MWQELRLGIGDTLVIRAYQAIIKTFIKKGDGIPVPRDRNIV